MYDQKYYESRRRLARRKLPKDLDIKLRFLAPGPGEKILDVGCGVGHITAEIAKRGAEVIGIDISEYAVEQGRKEYHNLPNLQLICLDALKMDYEHCFDKVFCDQVLEHFSPPERQVLLEKVYKSLKQGGILALGVPINDFIHHKYMRRMASFWGIIIDPSHKVNFSLQKLERELNSVGFYIEDLFPMFYLDIVRLAKGIYSIPLLGKYLVGGVDVRCVKRP